MACNRNRSGYNNNWNNGNRCGWNGCSNWYGCGAWSNWNGDGCGNWNRWNRCCCNRCNSWNLCNCAATSLEAEATMENSCNSCSCE
ncbi:MAG: hypothetical protein E7246_05690 [Lachnoclostridium sp.]|nr:hypothetical protein [Lachnoclostridium sp.]